MPSKLNPKIWTDTERKCRTCDVFKPFDNFHKQKGKTNGIQGQCKICVSASTQIKHSKKQYRLDNKEKIREQKKQYILDNKAKIQVNRSKMVECDHCKLMLSKGSMCNHKKTCYGKPHPPFPIGLRFDFPDPIGPDFKSFRRRVTADIDLFKEHGHSQDWIDQEVINRANFDYYYGPIMPPCPNKINFVLVNFIRMHLIKIHYYK
jgi:hypothetical protein